MLLKQLNYFATVAELGSFTEAAYALGIRSRLYRSRSRRWKKTSRFSSSSAITVPSP